MFLRDRILDFIVVSLENLSEPPNFGEILEVSDSQVKPISDILKDYSRPCNLATGYPP